ncbi:transmembrane protein 134 isoform X3 [Sorex araneus]|uniref:transmembrane protein 134 isoform X3 n=1 Tax=Sorex araneus TaxID=42254 RepID=UPI002433D258|nr:transmembrane protein 134 isoform X3 [Sorex araneus]
MKMAPRPLQSRMREPVPGQGQGLRPRLRARLPVVLQHTQHQHPALLQGLLQHPLVQKNHRVVLASFLLLLLGLGVFAQATAGRQLSWASEGGVWPGQLLLSGREPSGLTGAGLVPSPALTLATPRSVDPDRRGTGGGPQPRCLQCHILRAWLPAAGPWSLPRDLHLLRCPGSSGLPVLLPALLREVS